MTHDAALTRRAFTGAGLAGAAATLLPGSLQASALRRGDDRLRVGLVGCGGRGTGAAVQALKADAGAVLWAAGDLFSERVEPCVSSVTRAIGDTNAERIDAPPERRFAGFNAYQQVIDSGVDVVLLATPPGFRPEHLRAAVDADKHVFCEKPVAVDGPGVRSTLESARIAKEKNLSLMSGFCWRYQDQVRETFEHLLNGGVGRIITLQTTYNTTGWVAPKKRQPHWSETEFQARNWHYFTPISGDHIVEQAVHAIDWMAWALGDEPPARCTAVGGRQTRPETPETGNVFDNFSVTYEYANGARGYHMCRHWPNTPSDNSARILGSHGDCIMQPWQGRHQIIGEKAWRGRAPGNDMYQREHDVLFRAIRSGEPVNDGVSQARSTLLAIMGRMAAYSGKVVTWDEALNSDLDLNPRAWAFGPRPTPEIATPGTTVAV